MQLRLQLQSRAMAAAAEGQDELSAGRGNATPVDWPVPFERSSAQALINLWGAIEDLHCKEV